MIFYFVFKNQSHYSGVRDQRVIKLLIKFLEKLTQNKFSLVVSSSRKLGKFAPQENNLL